MNVTTKQINKTVLFRINFRINNTGKKYVFINSFLMNLGLIFKVMDIIPISCLIVEMDRVADTPPGQPRAIRQVKQIHFYPVQKRHINIVLLSVK